jgi:hypothetical protein
MLGVYSFSEAFTSHVIGSFVTHIPETLGFVLGVAA